MLRERGSLSGTEILRFSWSNGGPSIEKGQFFYSGPQTLDTITLSVPPDFTNESLLRQKYLVEGLSYNQMTRQFGCCKRTLKKYLRLYNIRKNTPGKSKYNLALGEKIIKGKVVTHQGEQRVLKTIVDMHEKENLSATAIARILNTMKIPTKRQGRKWNHSTVIGILKKEGLYTSTRLNSKIS